MREREDRRRQGGRADRGRRLRGWALAALVVASAEAGAAPMPVPRPAALAPPAPVCPAPCRAPVLAPRPGPRPAGLGGVRRAMLIGLVETGTGRAALLRLPGGQVSRLVEGARIRGWELRGIDADAAHFRRAGERLTLPLALP